MGIISMLATAVITFLWTTVTITDALSEDQLKQSFYNYIFDQLGWDKELLKASNSLNNTQSVSTPEEILETYEILNKLEYSSRNEPETSFWPNVMTLKVFQGSISSDAEKAGVYRTHFDVELSQDLNRIQKIELILHKEPFHRGFQTLTKDYVIEVCEIRCTNSTEIASIPLAVKTVRPDNAEYISLDITRGNTIWLRNYYNPVTKVITLDLKVNVFTRCTEGSGHCHTDSFPLQISTDYQNITKTPRLVMSLISNRINQQPEQARQGKNERCKRQDENLEKKTTADSNETKSVCSLKHYTFTRNDSISKILKYPRELTLSYCTGYCPDSFGEVLNTPDYYRYVPLSPCCSANWNSSININLLLQNSDNNESRVFMLQNPVSCQCK